MSRIASRLQRLPFATVTLIVTGVVSQPIRAAETPLNLLIIQTDEHHFSTLDCYGGTIVVVLNLSFGTQTVLTGHLPLKQMKLTP